MTDTEYRWARIALALSLLCLATQVGPIIAMVTGH